MRTTKREQGWFSVFVLTTLMLLTLIGLGMASYSVTSMKRSARDKKSAVAFQAAQAGLEQQIAQCLASMQGVSGDFTQLTRNASGDLNAIAPSCSATVTVKPLQGSPSYAWITSTVTYEGFTGSVRSLATSKHIGVWNNAIFAGTGASGQTINGNVDIRGSIHILGNGEYFTDINLNGIRDATEPYNDTNANGIYDGPTPPTTDNTSMSGSAYVGNNYSGMPPALEALVPPPPVVTGTETLGAELRLKHGRFALSGSATVGTSASVDGGSSKNTLDGVYVTDGWGGNRGASNAYSDNGTSEHYDLSDTYGIEFPNLNGIGAAPYVQGGTTWATQQAFLDARSLVCPVNTIKATTGAFSYGPDAYGNSISFSPQNGSNDAVLTVNGIVQFSNDLQIGQKDTIRYQGRGTLYVKRDLYVDGDLLPKSGLKFPTQSTVGLLALRNLQLATGNGSSQLMLAGAFYAQGKIVSQKQNQIAGTFVSNFYDLGNNVPNIYQVPSLINNMPPGMPGDIKIFTIKIRTWRRR